MNSRTSARADRCGTERGGAKIEGLPQHLECSQVDNSIDCVDSVRRERREEAERAKTKMVRGKQKVEAQKRNAEKNQKAKGSQLEARVVALKVSCQICKTPLANHNQLVDHYGSKHPKETPPAAPS